MSQAYSAAFARVYNQLWTGFALNAAPKIQTFYEAIRPSDTKNTMLDLCCGTGQLARHFLEKGYAVTGIDLSTTMLEFARQNNLPFIAAGKAQFIQGNAASFSLAQSFGLVVSTFDALNHLPGFSSLESCFDCTRAVLEKGGVFIFDLNTKLGLETHWNSMTAEDRPEFFLLNRSLWVEESRRAYTRITGFNRLENGAYERFEETVYNCAFVLSDVKQALLDRGFRSVYMARLDDLFTAVESPEDERRVFVVARG
jgi:SAM-dependent methyltransferase